MERDNGFGFARHPLTAEQRIRGRQSNSIREIDFFNKCCYNEPSLQTVALPAEKRNRCRGRILDGDEIK
ncbi:hypothetical protein EQM14_12345 [Caproiciproducens sp. NJN-50]|uniref:hypothetical protein n=1 Tax=Acutalibacteraceae TaxID=3082771 RepID=UPI000FFE0EFC|nr:MULTISPECIES: hypothetical protein [Acutalibacteraceae]QAT50488.1 hypothetical protein EQM14_12345 [Caproiciproducens sp. NJN-50]